MIRILFLFLWVFAMKKSYMQNYCKWLGDVAAMSDVEPSQLGLQMEVQYAWDLLTEPERFLAASLLWSLLITKMEKTLFGCVVVLAATQTSIQSRMGISKPGLVHADAWEMRSLQLDLERMAIQRQSNIRCLWMLRNGLKQQTFPLR